MASNVGKAYEFLKRHPYKIREALQPRKMVRAGGWNAWSLPVAIYAVVVSVQLRRKVTRVAFPGRLLLHCFRTSQVRCGWHRDLGMHACKLAAALPNLAWLLCDN
jgi:hypothetical protein